MRSHTIAIIAPPTRSHDADHFDDLFRHWPAGLPTPRLEPVSTDAILSGGCSFKLWDAAVLAVSEHSADSTWLRIADELHQASVPLLMLTPGSTDRLESFHPGAVLSQCVTSDPRITAAMLYALASRQTAVRAIEQNLRLAQSFQGETSAEIDRLHTELLLAARVQRDFLPKHMPEVEGLDVEVLFRPHGFVSGDTYDVKRLDEHHVSFFLADAMGHGVPAALMTLYIAGSLPRVEASPDGLRIVPPGEALTRLNAELHESLAGPSRFATAVCGVIDLRTRMITLACAGHPAPLRISKHGVRPVEVSGMLMGVVSDYQYEQVTIRLEDDELLVLHSDGLEEAFNPRKSPPAIDGTLPIPAHYSHMAGMRRGDAGQSLVKAMSFLGETIDMQEGSFHQDDDLTVLAFGLSRNALPVKDEQYRSDRAPRIV